MNALEDKSTIHLNKFNRKGFRLNKKKPRRCGAFFSLQNT